LDKDQITPAEIRRWRQNLQDEVNGAALYDALATAERDPQRSEVLKELAAVERTHAEVWAAKLSSAGLPAQPAPTLRTRLLAFLARRFGARAVLPVARAMEVTATGGYAGQADAAALRLPQQENGHARVVSAMAEPAPAKRETWHRSAGGGNLRAAVFGVNDGLLSNFSLIMGMAGGTAAAGAGAEHQMVLLAGFAGMLAGAFSMAAGEYVSVRSQRELFEREIAKEREELETSPAEEAEELELIYRAKGIPRAQAAQLAAALLSNPESALDTLAREELGLDPSELGSPWGAAGSSFLAFVVGALVPLLPFLLMKGPGALWISAAASGLSLFAIGATLSLFTGRSALWSGLRMLLVGGVVALATNLIGRAVGVAVS
jgi:vacuolar iron transporter family protein